MVARFRDGTIQSANLPTPSNTYHYVDSKIYRAMVLNYLYSDDSKNVTSKSKTSEVTYSVVILGGNESGQVISGVRMSRLLSGQFNFHNQLLRKSSKTLGVPLEQHDGDIVFIQFLQGNTSYAVITGFGVNLQDDGKSAIKKADGPSYKWQYNGVMDSIDKNGALTQLIKGGTYDQDKDVFTPKEESTINIKYDPTNQLISFDVSNGKTKAVIDAKTNKVTLTAGTTIVEIDGASGNIKLSGKTVDLGESVTDFVTMFTELCNAFNTHTHPYTDDGSAAITGFPLAPLLQTVGSQTIKVQP